MRRLHFNKLGPLCPRCRLAGIVSPLEIHTIEKEHQDTIIEGILACPNPQCLSEYPIIDGIPIIVPDLRTYISQNMYPLMQRWDLSHTMESIVGDCCGPGSFLDSVRQYLSTYGFAHYGEFDPSNSGNALDGAGSLVSLLRHGLGTPDRKITGPVIDMGCSVGRTSFELAQVCEDLVLGVDLNFSMVQTASKLMNTGLLSYPKRKVGMVYESMEYPVKFKRVTNLDFWVCDALALPFSDGKFSFALSYNLLDCVSSPYDHLQEIARLLKKNAKAIVSSPYDWTQGATPVEAWIGGHSQRGYTRGRSELLLRSLLSGGEHPNAIQELEIVSETKNFPWELRIHERSTMNYSVHMTMVKKK